MLFISNKAVVTTLLRVNLLFIGSSGWVSSFYFVFRFHFLPLRWNQITKNTEKKISSSSQEAELVMPIKNDLSLTSNKLWYFFSVVMELQLPTRNYFLLTNKLIQIGTNINTWMSKKQCQCSEIIFWINLFPTSN